MSTPNGQFGFGSPASAEEIAGWDIDVAADGNGLPAGSGTVAQGKELYDRLGAKCHGERGEGTQGIPALVGGIGSLDTDAPVKTVGSYWPYSTTLFDYVRRSMPIANPLSLTNDEVYAVSAYLLFINGILDEDAPMNAHSLPQVKMPNRDGFISDWPVRPR